MYIQDFCVFGTFHSGNTDNPGMQVSGKKERALAYFCGIYFCIYDGIVFDIVIFDVDDKAGESLLFLFAVGSGILMLLI